MQDLIFSRVKTETNYLTNPYAKQSLKVNLLTISSIDWSPFFICKDKDRCLGYKGLSPNARHWTFPDKRGLQKCESEASLNI